MTSELDMQSLITDAINDGDGFAFKAANRFLIGVSDLFVKCKGHPAGFLEVKRMDLAKTDLRYIFKLDVSNPQQRFLIKVHKAGMPCGVASFLQAKNKGLKSLKLLILTLTEAEHCGWMVNTLDHRELGESSARYQNIRQQVHSWLEKYPTT